MATFCQKVAKGDNQGYCFRPLLANLFLEWPLFREKVAESDNPLFEGSMQRPCFCNNRCVYGEVTMAKLRDIEAIMSEKAAVCV